MIFQLVINKYNTFIKLQKINKSLKNIEKLIEELKDKSDNEIKKFFKKLRIKQKNI